MDTSKLNCRPQLGKGQKPVKISGDNLPAKEGASLAGLIFKEGEDG